MHGYVCVMYATFNDCKNDNVNDCFFLFCSEHRLWVHVTNDILRWLQRVLKSSFQSKNKNSFSPLKKVLVL